MTQAELLKALDEWDRSDKWVFRITELYAIFSGESPQNIKISLSRHAKNGIIDKVYKGIYANPRAFSRRLTKDSLAYISNYIRDKGLSYLSLETVLSNEGVISQMPNRYTFVSKGRSAVFVTRYGILEYTHTQRPIKTLHKNCYFDEYRGVWVANTQQAIDDAYNFNRVVDLIEEQAAKDRGEYYGHH